MDMGNFFTLDGEVLAKRSKSGELTQDSKGRGETQEQTTLFQMHLQ